MDFSDFILDTHSNDIPEKNFQCPTTTYEKPTIEIIVDTATKWCVYVSNFVAQNKQAWIHKWKWIYTSVLLQSRDIWTAYYNPDVSTYG